MAGSEPYPEPYLATIHRGFQFARRLGHHCGPLHLLVGIAQGHDQAAAALAPGQGPPLPAVVTAAAGTFGDGAAYQHLQAQEAARSLARRLGRPPETGHLLIALIDQGTPDVLRALALAGLEPDAARAAAAAAAGAPAGLPPIAMPPLAAAGSMDRPPLPAGDLDERAWAALRWRQDHLPLGQLRGRGDLAALANLERAAAVRVADRLGLDDDQRFSLLSHHDAEVGRRTAAARPELGPRPRRPPAWQRRRRPRLMVGWGTWFGNRWVSARDRLFLLRTLGAYRHAPQP